ncbi:MAG: hypothetical protein H7835_09235 [Magnetococcus sp. XQGC-1]
MTVDFHKLFAPSVKILLDELDRLIGPLFLVGGTVRNMLQNRGFANELNLLVQRSLPECHQLLMQGGHPLVTLGTKRHDVWSSGHTSLFLPLKGGPGAEPDAGEADATPGASAHISHVEIATFRYRMEYPPTVQEDLLHRDLTVNAMAYAWPNGPLIDPFNGQEDLANRRIRFVKGHATLEDDPLRALRFFRFLLQLEGTPDEADLQAAEETAMEMIPKKKLRAELDRMFAISFSGPIRYANVQRFFYSSLAQEIFSDMATPPICKTGETPAHRCRRAIRLMLALTEPAPEEIVPLHDLRWAALFYAMGELNCIAREKGHARSTLHGMSMRRIQELLKKFRFSQKRQRQILQILQHVETILTPTDRTLQRLMGEEVPLPGLFRLIHAHTVIHTQGAGDDVCGVVASNATNQLLDAQLARVLERCRLLRHAKQRPTPHDLAISGGEILDMVRRPPGPWVGRLMAELLEWINQDRTRNQRALLYEKMREWIAHHHA